MQNPRDVTPQISQESQSRRVCQRQGLTRSHPNLVLVTVIRTASGTSAVRICPSSTRSKVAARIPHGGRVGIYAETSDGKPRPAPAKPEGATGSVKEFLLLGRILHIADTKVGPRAVNKGELSKPNAVEKYLYSKFGEHLNATRMAMQALAATLPPKELNAKAFHLYEQFRPEVPSDEKGWGAKGVLDLARIIDLSRKA